MQQGKVQNAFKNMAGGFQEFLHELAEPSEYTKAQICLDLAKEGKIVDPDSGDITGEIDPQSEDGMAIIQMCENDLRRAEANIPLSPEGGPP